MPVTPNMNITTPVEGGSADVWDVILNDGFDVIDAHDHSTGKGVRVPFATGVTISADTPWNSGGVYYAITGIKALDFQPRPTTDMTSYAGALFLNSADNELYWRTTGGTNVKLTAGTSINAALIGGIGGDYASVSALVDFVDASDLYRFRQQLGGGVQQYARGAFGDVDLYEFKAHPAGGVPANRVRLSSPAALAASYAITLGGALPAASAFVLMSAAGVLTYEPSPTVVSGQNITLAGTADIKHGDRVLNLHPFGSVNTANWAPNAASGGYMASSGAGTLDIPIPLRQGDRIKSVTYAIFGDGVADFSLVDVRTLTAAGVSASIGSTSHTNPPASWADQTIDTADTTLAAGQTAWLELNGNATGLRVGSVRVTYDRP